MNYRQEQKRKQLGEGNFVKLPKGLGSQTKNGIGGSKGRRKD